MPTDGFSIKPLKVKLLAGEQKTTEQVQWPVAHPLRQLFASTNSSHAAGAMSRVTRFQLQKKHLQARAQGEGPRIRASSFSEATQSVFLIFFSGVAQSETAGVTLVLVCFTIYQGSILGTYV